MDSKGPVTGLVNEWQRGWYGAFAFVGGIEAVTYQVSDLDNPRDDDQKVERYDTAEKLAQKRSLYRDCAQGVWDLNDQDAHGVFQPLVIAYRHNLYYYM